MGNKDEPKRQWYCPACTMMFRDDEGHRWMRAHSSVSELVGEARDEGDGELECPNCGEDLADFQNMEASVLAEKIADLDTVEDAEVVAAIYDMLEGRKVVWEAGDKFTEVKEHKFDNNVKEEIRDMNADRCGERPVAMEHVSENRFEAARHLKEVVIPRKEDQVAQIGEELKELKARLERYEKYPTAQEERIALLTAVLGDKERAKAVLELETQGMPIAISAAPVTGK